MITDVSEVFWFCW